MFVLVRLLQGTQKKFTYAVPQELQKSVRTGTFIQVPFKSRVIPAVVDTLIPANTSFNFEVREIDSLYQFPQDHQYAKFVHTVSSLYQTDSLYLFARMQSFLQEKEIKYKALPVEEITHKDDTSLTKQQDEIYQDIRQDVLEQQYQTSLIHGVTGSGKTEIYKKLIQDAVNLHKAVIVMLPEVTLALRFENIFAAMNLGVPVIGFHSATLMSQKRKLWSLLLRKEPVVIVGVHLPVLLPIANLGLIIIDEEHDAGYQEKKHPKLHSRDMAILKASLAGVPVVLGSATPSMQSLWNVEKKGWKFFELKKRFAGKFPTIEIVSLKTKKKRSHFWLTDQLQAEIADRLSKKEQTIIFLNRRGYSFFVQCTCSYVFSCTQCSVSLTLHADKYVQCHYCGYKELLAGHCPSCSTHSDNFLKKGIGTQQLVQMLQRLYPQATIARADADTTTKKRSWEQTVQEMLSGQIDILVGTQSITKGYHFPGVTLVGVLWADLNLHFPVYNAIETALQQLVQVAGRAGRQSEESKVVIQTFDDHDLYSFLSEADYLSFYKKEIEKRQLVGYPPCKHIAEIEIRNIDQAVLEQEAQIVFAYLAQMISDKKYDMQLLGPIAALVYRVKGTFCQKILLKSYKRHEMVDLFSRALGQSIKSSLFFVIDPVS